ncbi:hypothetical protein [Nocardioides sp.]|uniref:hypothetical protein n=1 Tax=Nocardioides sp. TaxID=35761 RepID=UPI002639B1D2|nr:hypothetical protein [Nocardioides sp.]MDI6910697.1 hypothetical protein [Nocardioides sp.]
MTAHTRFRIAVAIGALVAPLVVVATSALPADAGTSKHKHEVYMYKVEKNIRLSGVGSDGSADSGSQLVRCNAGDQVLDGMWSVKHVDQYQPPPPDTDEDPDFPSAPTLHGTYDDERDVWVRASYPDPSDLRSWQFEIENKAWGDAQVKLFLTCIRGYTEYANSHHHQIKVRSLFGGLYSAVDQGGWFTSEPQAEPWGKCATNEYFVAPGFDLGSANFRLRGTYPRAFGQSWGWSFITDGSPVPLQISIYGRCISRQVFDLATPRHAIAMKHLPGTSFGSWYASNIPQGDPEERQYTCDQADGDYHAYKAMVGWFYLDSHWDDNWFLGMEPRPKTRSYYFWNHYGGPAAVRYGTLCINSRTSNPLA